MPRSFKIASLCGAAFIAVGQGQEAPCASTGNCAGEEDEATNLLQIQKKNPLARKFWQEWLDEAFGRHGVSALQRKANYAECRMAESDSGCSLESMGGKPTLVYPGGETKCINGDEYAFAVTPGDTDKLLYYFQGGGACWEANGAYGKQVVQQCTASLQNGIASTGFGQGVQDMSNDQNPFKSYTIVEPIYCSGDAFMGNTTMTASDGTVLIQKGFLNGQTVMDWTKSQFKQELANFVIMGFSAGTLGTMAWAKPLLSSISYEKASVIFDSYAGFFPPQTQEATLSRWGLCGLPLLSSSLQAKCKANELTIQEVVEASMEAYPKVSFANIQSKVDGTQIWFYQGMAQSWGMAQDMQIQGPNFYEGTNTIFDGYNKQFENYVAFLVDGSLHCYTQAGAFYTASGLGKDTPGETMLYQWVADIVDSGKSETVCAGDKLANGADSSTYCDKELVTKTLTLR